jgi:AcrR family transcriptional regulator
MARTLNVEAHAIRRDTFVDAAMRLIQQKGYGQLSVQDVLEDTGASKGAFYHYFDSKEALLEAVTAKTVDAALAAVEPLLHDPERTAIEKLVGMFRGIAGWKNARKDLMLGLLEVWMSDDNLVVREKLRASMTLRLRPVFTAIVAEGVSEELFDVEDPSFSAGVVLLLITGAQDWAARLFIDCQNGAATILEARKMISAFQQALERILGAPEGSLTYVDENTIQMWFG